MTEYLFTSQFEIEWFLNRADQILSVSLIDENDKINSPGLQIKMIQNWTALIQYSSIEHATRVMNRIQDEIPKRIEKINIAKREKEELDKLQKEKEEITNRLDEIRKEKLLKKREKAKEELRIKTELIRLEKVRKNKMKRATNILWFLLFLLAMIFMVVAVYNSWILP